jgi:hypothetical protein
MVQTGAHQEMDRQSLPTGNSSTPPLEMGRHFFLLTALEMDRHFFVLTGNGSTHFSDNNWIIVS